MQVSASNDHDFVSASVNCSFIEQINCDHVNLTIDPSDIQTELVELRPMTHRELFVLS